MRAYNFRIAEKKTIFARDEKKDRMTAIADLFRDLWTHRPSRLRRRRMTITAAAVDITANEHAAAIYSGIVDLILSAIKRTRWVLVSGPADEWGAVSYFFEHNADTVTGQLINDGCVTLVKDGFSWQISEGAGDYIMQSSDWRLRNVSTYTLLRPALDYLNNIVNAADTSIRRLGVMSVFSPKSDEYGNTLSPSELIEEERRFADDYGVLSSQRLVKFLSHGYDIQTINVAGADLQLTDRFTQAVKIICGKLKVPFELVPCAVLGNTNQTGVYQGEAVKRLYQTVAEWQQYFIDFATSRGLEVRAENPLAPQDYNAERVDIATKTLTTLQGAVSAGFLSQEEARAEWRRMTDFS